MKIVIVDSDTLRAIGLRHLISSRHEREAVITDAPQRVGGLTDTTVFFVTPEAFASMPFFYVPRRQRVALITANPVSPLPVVTPGAPEAVLCRQIDDFMRRMDDSTPPAMLSPRERDVLALVARGLINKEIAERLDITFNTVLTHRKNITAKLGIKSVAALSVYAITNGIISHADAAADNNSSPT